MKKNETQKITVKAKWQMLTSATDLVFALYNGMQGGGVENPMAILGNNRGQAAPDKLGALTRAGLIENDEGRWELSQNVFEFLESLAGTSDEANVKTILGNRDTLERNVSYYFTAKKEESDPSRYLALVRRNLKTILSNIKKTLTAIDYNIRDSYVGESSITLKTQILKENLLGVYLHGSAVMGCYQPQKSDLDFLVVVRENMTDTDKRVFLDSVIMLDAAGPAKGIEMSIVTRDVCDPFVYPTPFILHYSRMHTAWYRRDPEDYIRKMNGTDRDLAAHFTVIRDRGQCLYGLPVPEVFGEVPEEDYLDALWEDISGAEEEITENPMYLILNLARVLAYLKGKKVLSKKEGGEWGLAALPEEYHVLLRSALKEYAEGINEQYDPETAKRYAVYMLDQIRAERERL